MRIWWVKRVPTFYNFFILVVHFDKFWILISSYCQSFYNHWFHIHFKLFLNKLSFYFILFLYSIYSIQQNFFCLFYFWFFLFGINFFLGFIFWNLFFNWRIFILLKLKLFIDLKTFRIRRCCIIFLLLKILFFLIENININLKILLAILNCN